MKRLRAEHDRVFGPDLATAADLIRQHPSKTNELEYTTAVLKETLRIFPIGSGLRQNPDDSYVQLCPYPSSHILFPLAALPLLPLEKLLKSSEPPWNISHAATPLKNR
jgi:hypothetical protein